MPSYSDMDHVMVLPYFFFLTFYQKKNILKLGRRFGRHFIGLIRIINHVNLEKFCILPIVSIFPLLCYLNLSIP